MTPRKRQSRDNQDGPARDPEPARRPASGDNVSPHGTDEEDPARPRDFRQRIAEEIEDPSPQEHPDGSAPLLDRLTQDLDPSKDI